METEADLDGDGGQAIGGTSECASTTAEDAVAGDLAAFLLGFATITALAPLPG